MAYSILKWFCLKSIFSKFYLWVLNKIQISKTKISSREDKKFRHCRFLECLEDQKNLTCRLKLDKNFVQYLCFKFQKFIHVFHGFSKNLQISKLMNVISRFDLFQKTKNNKKKITEFRIFKNPWRTFWNRKYKFEFNRFSENEIHWFCQKFKTRHTC